MSEFCDRALTEVYLYLDRELTWWRRRQIRLHLHECPPCLQGYHFEERLRFVVRERLAEEVPQEFLDRLHATIRNERAPGA